MADRPQVALAIWKHIGSTERNLNIQPTITIRPGWPLRIIVLSNMVLRPYPEIYRRDYGCKEGVADLIPFMLEAFMNADPGFKRARKALGDARTSSTQAKET